MKCKICRNNVPQDESLRRTSCCRCNTVYIRREVAYVCDICSCTWHFSYEFVTEDQYNKKQLSKRYETCPECKKEWGLK